MRTGLPSWFTTVRPFVTRRECSNVEEARAATRQRYHGIKRPIDLPSSIDRGNVICPDSILCTIWRAVAIARACGRSQVERIDFPHPKISVTRRPARG